jgi:hypothetical protein
VPTGKDKYSPNKKEFGMADVVVIRFFYAHGKTI